mmetsp:Transcript_6410/g.12667  ORF Transcript_6410/g.12667 Transcript_6410/m.12667 type:complete len:132 (+) Transcript_6410:452-847(+)
MSLSPVLHPTQTTLQPKVSNYTLMEHSYLPTPTQAASLTTVSLDAMTQQSTRTFQVLVWLVRVESSAIQQGQPQTQHATIVGLENTAPVDHPLAPSVKLANTTICKDNQTAKTVVKVNTPIQKENQSALTV